MEHNCVPRTSLQSHVLPQSFWAVTLSLPPVPCLPLNASRILSEQNTAPASHGVRVYSKTANVNSVDVTMVWEHDFRLLPTTCSTMETVTWTKESHKSAHLSGREVCCTA